MPTAAPDIRVSLADPAGHDAAIARILAILRRTGAVVLDGIVDEGLIGRCRAHVEHACPDMARTDPVRNFGVDPGRHTMPLVIAGPLADPAICVPPVVATIAGRLLGEKFKVDSFGLLVAAPGAPQQRRHPDGTLFPDTSLDGLLPPFALAFALPLVMMDEESGRTAFWSGSHRTGRREGAWDLAETVGPGSALLWDYRVHHCGLANHGDRPRPVLFAALSREWWVEIDPPAGKLYHKLQVAREVWEGLPPEVQHRFSRARVVDEGGRQDSVP